MAISQNRIVFVASLVCFTLLGGMRCANAHDSKRKLTESGRVYQIGMSTLFAHGNSQQITTRGRALVEYHLASPQTNGAPSLSIIPQMLQYQDSAYLISINSFDDKSRGARLTGILHQGMRLSSADPLTVEPEFLAQRAWEAFKKKQGDRAVATLTPLLSLFVLNPLLPTTGEVQIGDRLTPRLGHFNDWLVEAITDKQVTASMQQQTGPFRRYGRLSYDRNTGWIDKLLLVEQQRQGNKTQTRRWVLAPKTSQFVSAMLWQDEGGDIDDNLDEQCDASGECASGELTEFELFDIPTLEVAPDDPHASTTMMSQAQGIMSVGRGGDDIELSYIHGLLPGEYAASVDYRNIRLFDWQDREIDLPLWRHSNHRAKSLGGVVSSAVNLLPTSWGDSKAKLEELYRVRADLYFTPVKRFRKRLDWKRLLNEPYRYGTATLTLSPLKQSGHYRLSVVNDDTHALSPNFNGLDGKLGVADDQRQGPAWLSTVEQLVLDELFPDHKPSAVYVLQLTQEPAALEILHSAQHVDGQIKRNITFVPRAEYEANLANPPVELHSNLWGETPSVDYRLEQPKVTSLSGHDLFIALPTALAEICVPQIDEGFTEGTNPVQWHLISNGQGQSAYVLTTQDDKRRYFYDQSVRGSIHCQGQARWRSIAVHENERPWLVDLSSWLPDLDTKMLSFAALERKLLITDAKGRPLTPRRPKDGESLSLQELLIDGRWLSVNGSASHVAYLEVVKAPHLIPYQFKFKPLP